VIGALHAILLGHWCWPEAHNLWLEWLCW